MKPFYFQFPCPDCGVVLQAEPAQQNNNTNCPQCNADMMIPHAPARPIGGWLFIPALGYTFQIGMVFLVLLVGALDLKEKPELLLGALFSTPVALFAGIGAWAMWKKKRWFRWYFLANCWGSTFLYSCAALYLKSPELGGKTLMFALWSIIWTAYFLRSKRVKETFIC